MRRGESRRREATVTTRKRASWWRVARSHESCERTSCARKARSYGGVFGSRRVCAHTPHTPRVCAATAATHVWARGARSHCESGGNPPMRQVAQAADSDLPATVPPWAKKRPEATRERPPLATEFVWAVRTATHGRDGTRWGPPWATRRGGLVRRYHPVASDATGRTRGSDVASAGGRALAGLGRARPRMASRRKATHGGSGGRLPPVKG